VESKGVAGHLEGSENMLEADIGDRAVFHNKESITSPNISTTFQSLEAYF
jgi:hypothetical protein